MKRKFLIGLTVTALMSLATLSGCSSSVNGTADNSTGQKVKINFWYTWGGKEGSVMDQLIKEYNASQNKIQVVGLSQGDEQKQMTAIVGNNPPDLASQYDQDNVASWSSKGAMTPLDDFMKKDHYDTSDFLPAALKAVQYNDKTYALPIVMNTWMLYYNKDLFKKAGIANPPQTMQELKADADKLSIVDKKGNLERIGLWPEQDPTMYMFSFDGSIWDPAKKEITPDNPGFKATVQFYKDMWDKYGSSNLDRYGSGLGNYASAQNPFFTGQAAMAFDGEWLTTFVKEYAPNLNYGVVPIPYDESHPDAKNAGYINVGALYIPKGSKHPQEAWEFLKWLTSKAQMVKLATSLGNLAPRKSALNDPSFKRVPGFTEFLKYSQGPKMSMQPQVPFLNDYLAEISTEYDAILRGKTSVDSGLKAIKDKIQPLAQNTN
ncbi:ABC transporter substrate-binding protein [Heyndrickxia acidicola]|uniref:ABC transporter substrate-binding protein n=1 Tax=Heyndrickxia acidicola TaxID=209389 RepID=A0ABU6MBC0_9BACI|nr:ABC transporter substrate-binding protein [Heyndrickxia acidicola]MED1201800.1 ABC transporter substrate-binding protein [Heyndrickxia acidicola]